MSMVPGCPTPGHAIHTKETKMNEFFTPLAQRAQLATHSAGHCNALVENPFDEVETAESI